MELSRAAAVPNRLAAEALAQSTRSRAEGYSDRLRSAAETVARMRDVFPELGITRVARVTGLDRIGIPVFLAVRPNSRTLAVTQGKGVDDDAARASAVMESAEQATAERPRVPVRAASLRELKDVSEAHVAPGRFLRRGAVAPRDSAIVDWVEGFDLVQNRVTWVPIDVVTLDFTQDGDQRASPFWQTTDGLASGNNLLEAVVHGLCERIERDASAVWCMRPPSEVARRCVAAESFGDPVLSDLARRIAHAGLRLTIFDITSDIQIPTYLALISETRPAGAAWRHFDLSRGTGTHPVAVRAALRAVTEAAQSRLTSISGARDDFSPSTYAAGLRPELHVYANAEPVGWKPKVDHPASGLGDYLRLMLDRVGARGVRSVVVVPLGGEELGFSVAKVIVPDLEDPPESRYRRPGRRAINAMLAPL